MMPRVNAECYFLDVAQGTSNVILLGQRRAVVIDCGRSASVPLKLLRRYVDEIVALVVSHNDRDHHGGAAAILCAYPKAIHQLYFLQDRPIEHLSLLATAKRELEAGNLLRPPIRLERGERPRIIYRDSNADLTLELLFPTFLDNLDAQAASSPNASSAVLALSCGSRRVIYPGDATIEEWRRIHARLGAPIQADVISVPHHAGNISQRAGREDDCSFEVRARGELQWLYRQAVRCDHAVVSVGTSNAYRHPREPTVRMLVASNTVVICTQITAQCHDDLESLRPGVIRPLPPAQSRSQRDSTRGGRSRNIACASTVLVEVGTDHIVIRRLQQHQDAVDGLCHSPDGHPLCRPNVAQPA